MTDHGKWSEEEVPHKGWACDGVVDLGEPAATCEMCEFAVIRYVHHMSHPDYPEALGVGCVCAENMAEDYVGPRLREKALRDRARRLKSWPRREWHRALSSSNFYLNTEGYRLVVYQPDKAWRLGVCRHGEPMTWGRRRYTTAQDAQLAGLDALLWAKGNL